MATWFASQGCNCFIVNYLDKAPSLPSVQIFTEYLQVRNDAATWAQSRPGVDPGKLQHWETLSARRSEFPDQAVISESKLWRRGRAQRHCKSVTQRFIGEC